MPKSSSGTILNLILLAIEEATIMTTFRPASSGQKLRRLRISLLSLPSDEMTEKFNLKKSQQKQMEKATKNVLS